MKLYLLVLFPVLLDILKQVGINIWFYKLLGELFKFLK